jgi:hypothetical protein
MSGVLMSMVQPPLDHKGTTTGQERLNPSP